MANKSAFAELLEQRFEWPQTSDAAFVDAVNWLEGAHLTEHGDARLVMMTGGYKIAGDLMVQRSLEDRCEAGQLVYPILFNYRHFLELSLKYLIATYGPSIGVGSIWNTHSLEQLWRAFLSVLKGYGHKDLEGTDAAVGLLIAEFAKADPTSFSHRYPVDTKGRPIPLARDEFDLKNLRLVVEKLDNYFTGCDGYLDALKSAGP